MHPAYVVMNAIRISLSILVVFIISFVSYGSFSFFTGVGVLGLILIIVGFIVMVGITAGISYIYYRRFLWEITESDIHIYSGIFFKKQVHIPFQRVQSIDFNAQVIERVLGIVKLKIETAGGSQNRGVFIPALKLAQAEALRAEVFARKRQASAQQEAAMRQQMLTMKAGMAPAAAAPAAASVAQPRFDPQTGQPFATAQPQPRFDPQTGQPFAAAVGMTAAASATAWTAPSSADALVAGVGAGLGELRGIFAESYQEEAPIEYEYGLTAKELVLSAISGDHNFVLVAVLIGLATQIGEVARLIGLDYSAEALVERFLTTQVVPVIIGALIVMFLVIFVLGILGTAVSYGGFKARRRGGRIEVERGLVSRQYRGVSINRIQAVEIKQGFIRRLMGYVELNLHTIDSLGTQQNNQNNQPMKTRGLVIHPFVKKQRVEEILTQLLPEYNERPAETELRGLPKVARRRVIIRHTVFIGLIYAACAVTLTALLTLVFADELPARTITWILIVLWVLFLLLLIGRTISSLLWYRHAAYTYNATMLMIQQGYFGLETTFIPRQKIQWAQNHQNPFQRWAKVASISAVTAAGIGGTKTRLRDVQVEESLAYLEWIRPHTRPSS